MTAFLASSGAGLALCDRELNVIYESREATRLFARLELDRPAAYLPKPLRHLVTGLVEQAEMYHGDRLFPANGRSPIEIHVALLRETTRPSVAIWLREKTLHDEGLHTLLKERFAVSLRGCQLAMLLREGLTNRQIAAHLGLKESTVKIYLHQLYRACGVQTRTALVALLERSRHTNNTAAT
jgi:DNA-binding CsgD family transcriptional regulator